MNFIRRYFRKWFGTTILSVSVNDGFAEVDWNPDVLGDAHLREDVINWVKQSIVRRDWQQSRVA